MDLLAHWLLWDDHLPTPTATIVWDANLADVARELGRRIEGPFTLADDDRGAVDLLREAHDRDRIDGSMPSIDWYKRVDAYLNPQPPGGQ